MDTYSERPLLQDKGPDFYACVEVPSETHFRHLNKIISFPQRHPLLLARRVLVENQLPPQSRLGEVGLG